MVDGWPLSVTAWKAFAYMERCLGDLKLSADRPRQGLNIGRKEF